MNPFIKSRALDTRVHDLSVFDCGDESYNTWLRTSAVSARTKNEANTYVWTCDRRVVGYYTLSAHLIVKEDLPSGFKGGVANIPAVLLGKMALDRSMRGRGNADALVADAVARVVMSTTSGPAARVVLVDIEHDAVAAFYHRLGFKFVRNSSHKLFIKVSTAKANLEAAASAVVAAAAETRWD